MTAPPEKTAPLAVVGTAKGRGDGTADRVSSLAREQRVAKVLLEGAKSLGEVSQ